MIFTICTLRIKRHNIMIFSARSGYSLLIKRQKRFYLALFSLFLSRMSQWLHLGRSHISCFSVQHLFSISISVYHSCSVSLGCRMIAISCQTCKTNQIPPFLHVIQDVSTRCRLRQRLTKLALMSPCHRQLYESMS